MEQIFNPYREWLGWEHSRAPDYYELLAIDRGEQDAARIAQAAEQAIAKVRSFRPGPQAQVWSRLIDEIRAAKACLCDAAQKAKYNARLERTDLYPSAAGDLQSSAAGAALPPPSWAAGPSPMYDKRLGFVTVPSAPTGVPSPGTPLPAAAPLASAASYPAASGELPMAMPVRPRMIGASEDMIEPAIDDLLPVGAVDYDGRISETVVEAELVAVSTAPTAASLAAERKQRLWRGLALAAVGGGALVFIAAGILLFRSGGPLVPAKSSGDTVVESAETGKSRQVVRDVNEATVANPSIRQPEVAAASAASSDQRLSSRAISEAPVESTTAAAAPASPGTAVEGSAKGPAIAKTLEAAKTLLSEQDFSLADEQLARAESLAESAEQRQAVGRLKEIGGYVNQFHEALVAAAQGMQAGETFMVGNSVEVVFVEAIAEGAIVRTKGTNYTYSFREMPPGLAVAIADRKLPARNPMSKVVKGAYLAVHKRGDSQTRERAKALWEEAGVAGIEVSHLMPILTESDAAIAKEAVD